MSVLRLSVLSRIFREQYVSGNGPCLLCRRGPARGCLLGNVYRWTSSARPKDKAAAFTNCKIELLEVLEHRVQQLQAEETASMLEHRSSAATVQMKGKEKAEKKKPVETPKRWMEKLKNEQVKMHQRKERLNGKTVKTVSHPDETSQQAPVPKPPKPPKTPSKKSKKTLEHKNNIQVPIVAPTEVEDPHVSKLLLEDKDGNRYGGVQMSILCYLETCIFLGDLDRAQQCLNYYHQNHSRRTMLTTAMYNLLMRAWAKKSSLHHIGQIFVMLEEADVKPNVGSYVATLECMGRKDSTKSTIEKCLMRMEASGISKEQLFKDFPYEGDEQYMVLKAIRTVHKDFQPPPPTKVVCMSPLVQEFYRKEPHPQYPKLDFTVSDLRDRFDRQLETESCDTVTIASVEAVQPVTDDKKEARALLDTLRSQWEKSLLLAFRDSKKHLEAISRKIRKINLYPYLCLLDDEQYVQIMMQSLTRIPPTGESFLLMSRELGNKIFNRISIRRKLQGRYMEKMQEIYTEYCQLLAKDGQVSGLLPREMWEQLEADRCRSQHLINLETSWPNALLVQVGTYLVDLIVQEIKLPSNLLSPRSESKLIPVLYHMYSFRSTRQIGLIKPHPIFSQILSEAGETQLTFESYIMPMQCPPVPWTSPRFGAYLLSPAKLMRCVEGAIQHQLLLEKSPPGQLNPVLDSLNQLGICAWRINQPLLDIIVSIFNDKGNEKLDIPPPLSEAPQMPLHVSLNINSWDKMSYQRDLAKCRKKTSEMYSLRMDSLYKLSIANHLRDKIFWFPHNMDFRGRTYPCPPYFNHLGGDVMRALLLFAEGRPLGPKGLDWLKIHLINLTGLKKKNSIKERKEYAESIMEDILDSAERPLTGKKWWMEADEPWQALACCMEIANALRSPDPSQYISHFPVHQDGSCNGLQHYAALGRDEIGAKSVNLMPCDTPQDVYSGVAQQVEEFRKRDARRGVKIAQVLDGFIGRKLVKQTVMTVVYGVTRYGGRLQIEKRLREMESFPQDFIWDASHYLVKQVFSSLKEMFSGTREIQLWLTESARMISKAGYTVEWKTPLGLPIIQPYHRSKHTMFSSNLQIVNLQSSHDANERPDTLKQKNAFPPNFIHSLDSTHMMLTALHCYSHGLTFVSVHDCFWTHADSVDIMNKVCREQFVALHSQPILQNLSTFLLQKYCQDSETKLSDCLRMSLHFSKVPETGDFDLEQVKESTYFFS
ncbi:DNA-directed RNA polymerase, mitochondrial [Spea bombifrons]|uniref:DNA-directed RNA polymerase, mitochondrial n=1 Tax=Spea bombifrons TaxID=233779 RepID=UPI002348FFB5|nr:DNA-directed RNA polymerase, mitochondrial [Spea bombifrons]